VFEDAYKSFYLKFDEPNYVKKIKLDILPLLTNLDNYQEVLLELSEYVLDVNLVQAREAIHSVAQVAIHLGHSEPQVVDIVLFKLLEFLQEEEVGVGIADDRLCSQVLDAFKLVLQEFPDKSELIVLALPRFVSKETSQPESSSGSSAIWMLGEFGQSIESSPYLLERLVDRLEEENKMNSNTKCELLSALLKLFFKQRALEVRPALEKLFKLLLSDTLDVDAHDRALFYFRLLKNDVFKAGEIINSNRHSLFADMDDGEEDDELANGLEKFNEFNSLAVLFGKKSDQFTDSAHIFPFEMVSHSEEPSFLHVESQVTDDYVTPPEVYYLNGFEMNQAQFQNMWINGEFYFILFIFFAEKKIFPTKKMCIYLEF
jgi:AP-4 complex subunit beta-1